MSAEREKPTMQLTDADIAEIRADIDWLVQHPGGSLGAKYHDSGSCWNLINVLIDDIERLRGKYHELLYAVGNKYEGETRHETALRYIRERESSPLQAAVAARKEAGDA